MGALGESAGGHLAALLAVLGSGARDAGSRVDAAVSLSGPMDLGALLADRGAPAWGRGYWAGPSSSSSAAGDTRAPARSSTPPP
jgi:acetyl esterase/lipase